MKSQFPKKHWDEKIPSYGAHDWAHSISPFAQEVLKHIPEHSTVLELGTGAGQDAVGFSEAGHIVTATDATETYFDEIRQRAQDSSIVLERLDLFKAFTFDDKSFDLVYAHLVLQYFDDDVLSSIIAEIHRVLKPNGYLAALLNSTSDPEFYDSPIDGQADMRRVDGITKRYFSPQSFSRFVDEFDDVILDNQGSTPKDIAKGISNHVRFIGRRRGD